MNYAERLRRARAEQPAVWVQFITAYRENRDDIYVFFEGRDDFSFYMPELRRRWSGRADIYPFKCNGRAAVLQLLADVKKRIDKEWRALFFVDKDLSNFLGEPKKTDTFLFETEWYSVENYLASERIIRIIWTEIFLLPVTDPRLEAMLDAYRTSREIFIRKISILMAWILFHRSAGRKPNAQNIDLDKVFNFNPDCSVSWKSDSLAHLDEACGVSTPQRAWRDLRALMKRFIGHSPKSYVRGKFELWHVVKIVQITEATVCERTGPGARGRVLIQIRQDNAVEALAGRDTPPESLRRFLDNALLASGLA